MGEHKRVPGHTLRSEGAAYEAAAGQPDRTRRVRWNSTSGDGFGLCSCGARSAIYRSASLRRAWHRAHKAEVVARG